MCDQDADVLSAQINFERDMTIRWSCRKGDYVLWIRMMHVMSDEPKVNIRDVWEMNDGDAVTITNRQADFPAWFTLYPDEVSGLATYSLCQKLNSGAYHPADRVEGPNLWRIMAGDRLTFVGLPRPGMKAAEGVLSILDFRENALAVGEQKVCDLNAFGGFREGHMSPREVIHRCRTALRVIMKMGTPIVFADPFSNWTIDLNEL